MKVYLLAAGTRMPAWVSEGYRDYARRLPPGLLNLVEIPVAKRTRTGHARAREDEGARMLAAVPPRGRIVTLEVRGKAWDTAEVAARLGDWMREGDDVALLIGGPDGLSPACREKSQERWSLSPLTLPHGLARVVVAEQVYRAWSILERLPYHRA